MADVERPWTARACPEYAYRMRAFRTWVGGEWIKAGMTDQTLQRGKRKNWVAR